PAQIKVTVVVPGEERIARAKREPHLNTRTWAADKSYQSRRIDRPYSNHIRSRHPSPTRTNQNPPSVVERSKSPGLIFNPGPPPRFYPGPASITIRRPVCRHAARIPDLPVIRGWLPLAVLIKIVVSRNVVAGVLARVGRKVATVAVIAP